MRTVADKKTLEQMREEAARLRKKRARKSLIENVLLGIVIAVAVVALVALLFSIGGAVFYLAWNLGVVNLVAAAGGSVSTINFWTAIGGSVAVGIIRGIFRREQTAAVKS